MRLTINYGDSIPGGEDPSQVSVLSHGIRISGCDDLHMRLVILLVTFILYPDFHGACSSKLAVKY